MRNQIYLFLSLIFLFPYSLSAETKNVLKIITAPEVKEILRMKNGILINALTNIEYDMQHIPGSINIPFHELEQ